MESQTQGFGAVRGLKTNEFICLAIPPSSRPFRLESHMLNVGCTKEARDDSP